MVEGPGTSCVRNHVPMSLAQEQNRDAMGMMRTSGLKANMLFILEHCLLRIIRIMGADV